MRFPTHLFPMTGTNDNPITPQQLQANRALATDYIRNVGTGQPPSPPRDLQVIAAPRGIQVTWGLPLDGGNDITGWVIYSPTDTLVRDSIMNRSTRQYVLAGSAGAQLQGFVASVNGQGIKSTPVYFTGTALTESGAPSYPSTPPGWSSGGGSDTGDTSGEVSPPIPHR